MELQSTLESLRQDGLTESNASAIRDAWKTDKKAWKAAWAPALEEVLDEIPDEERCVPAFTSWVELKNPKPWLMLIARTLVIKDDKFNAKRAEQLGASKIFEVLTHLKLSGIMKKFDADAFVTLVESPGFNSGHLESFHISCSGKTKERDWARANAALTQSAAMQTMQAIHLGYKFSSTIIGPDFPMLTSVELQDITLRDANDVRAFVTWSVLPQLSHLVLGGRSHPSLVDKWVKQNNLNRLESLQFDIYGSSKELNFAKFSQMDSLNCLRHLKVNFHQNMDPYAMLADSEHISLLSLACGYSVPFVRDSFIRYIGEPMASNLDELVITTFPSGSNATEKFAPERLAEEFGVECMRALIAAAPPIRRLALRGQYIDADTLELLLSSPLMQKIEHLDLRDTPVGNRGASMLAASSAVQDVELLLDGAMLDEVGVAALEASPYISEHARQSYRSTLERGRFVTPVKGYDELMGELRSFVARDPSRNGFSEICQRLDDFAQANLEQAREQVLPYLQEALKAWPRMMRMVTLSKNGCSPSYRESSLPTAPLRYMSSHFTGEDAKPKPHELSIELVKGAHVVLNGGYGRYNHSLRPEKLLESKRFCALEAVVFDRCETTEEQEYDHDFSAEEVMAVVNAMPHLVEVHIGTSVNLRADKFFGQLAQVEERWDVLGAAFGHDLLEHVVATEAFSDLTAVYVEDTFTLSDFESLCHAPHLGKLRNVYCTRANRETIDAHIAELSGDERARATQLTITDS